MRTPPTPPQLTFAFDESPPSLPVRRRKRAEKIHKRAKRHSPPATFADDLNWYALPRIPGTTATGRSPFRYRDPTPAELRESEQRDLDALYAQNQAEMLSSNDFASHGSGYRRSNPYSPLTGDPEADRSKTNSHVLEQWAWNPYEYEQRLLLRDTFIGRTEAELRDSNNRRMERRGGRLSEEPPDRPRHEHRDGREFRKLKKREAEAEKARSRSHRRSRD